MATKTVCACNGKHKGKCSSHIVTHPKSPTTKTVKKKIRADDWGQCEIKEVLVLKTPEGDWLYVYANENFYKVVPSKRK